MEGMQKHVFHHEANLANIRKNTGKINLCHRDSQGVRVICIGKQEGKSRGQLKRHHHKCPRSRRTLKDTGPLCSHCWHLYWLAITSLGFNINSILLILLMPRKDTGIYSHTYCLGNDGATTESIFRFFIYGKTLCVCVSVFAHTHLYLPMVNGGFHVHVHMQMLSPGVPQEGLSYVFETR